MIIKNVLQKLHTRIALVLISVFLIVSYFTANMVLHSAQIYQQHVIQKMNHELAEHVVDHYLLFKDGRLDLEQAKHTFHDLMILGPNFEFYILDKQGQILAFSAKPEQVKQTSVKLAPLQNYLSRGIEHTPIFGTNPRSETPQHKVFTVAKIEQDEKLLGYLYVILGSDIYDNIADAMLDSKIFYWGILILIFGVLFSFVTTLFLTGLVVQPISKLAEQTRSFCKTGFKKKGSDAASDANQLESWNENSHNEIHILGSTFRKLLEKLEEQYNHAITLDELRKELLAHVSHDLRTPLASLLGYLETWQLNAGKFSLEESQQYIAIAHRNAQTISNLVEQLFELAHLDSGNVQIRVERFPITELVQDVLQKFAITAKEKNITLTVTPQDSSIFVVGDIEKLERVFTNLLENAIRHTKNGGTIRVHFSQQGTFVGIEVSDTGIGIPKEDLPFVFDAHYKAGNSVRGNSRHGGIGLAITKRIIDLHRSSINVTSKVNQGTTFSFALPSGAAQYAKF